MRYTPKTTTPATIFGAREAGNFSIAVNGKMFNVLIDGLYTNKIESIVRESCANARDGHMKRGNMNTPFLVHAPSTLEPWYSVRDYGCSMDHEMVMKLYTTLGWSSKEESDTMVGCFGLGSKAPFAYAETFSVTTFLDGIKRIYVCYMDDDDQPKIILSDESPTDEEVGVEVSIPVKEEDFRSFRSAIRRVVLGYDTPFLCPGVDLPVMEYVKRSEGFDVVKRGNGAYGYLVSDVLPLGPYARIGVVLYPIDHTNETLRAALEERDPALRNFISNQTTGDLIINVPISIAAVTPSREFLSYTKAMIETIVGVYEGMFENLKKEVKDLYEGCVTKWDFSERHRSISKRKSVLSSYAESNYGAFITEWGQVNRFLRCDVDGYTYNHPVRNGGMFECDGDNKLERTSHGDRGTRTVLILGHADEVPTHAPTRVAQYIRANDFSRAIVIRFYDIPKVMKVSREVYMARNPLAKREERKTHLSRLYKTLKEYESNLRKFIEEYECPYVVKESDLTLTKVERSTNTFSMFTVYEPNGENSFSEAYHRGAEFWSAKKVIVVPLTKRANPQWVGGTAFLKRMLSISGVECDEILAVSVSNLPDMRKHFPHWIMIEDAIAKVDIDKIQDIFDSFYIAETFGGLVNTSSDSFNTLKRIIKPTDGIWFTLPDAVREDVQKFITVTERLNVSAEEYRKKAKLASVRDSEAKLFIQLLNNYGVTGLTPAKSTPEFEEIVTAITYFRDLYPEIDAACNCRSWGMSDAETGRLLVLASYLIGRRENFVVTFDPTPPEPPASSDEPVMEIP